MQQQRQFYSAPALRRKQQNDGDMICGCAVDNAQRLSDFS
jgi:hypothetical protein